MRKEHKKVFEITITVFIYIIMGLSIWYVSVAYPGFLNVYGDKSFSKGVF